MLATKSFLAKCMIMFIGLSRSNAWTIVFFFDIDKILSHGKVFEMYPEPALCQCRKNKALLLSILVRKIGCRARAALILMGTCLSLDERDKSFGIISPSSH